MRYAKGETVSGVKILNRTHFFKEVRRTKEKGTRNYHEKQYRYRTENINCGCTKLYTHSYLRKLDLVGRVVKCPRHTRDEEARQRNRKPGEVNRSIPESAADLIVPPVTSSGGFVWGQQGGYNVRSYQLEHEC